MNKWDLILEWLSNHLPLAGGTAHAKVLEDALVGSETVLDVGCGRGTFKVYKQYESTGIDIFPESVARTKENGNYKNVILMDVKKLNFTDKSFDCVTCNEVIEHLEKEDGWKLLENIERIARKTIVIMTPNGLDILPKRKDNPYLDHLSGWYTSEFKKRGYKIIYFMSIKWRLGNNPVLLIFAYGLSVLLRPLIWMFPEWLSNDFAAVKRIK